MVKVRDSRLLADQHWVEDSEYHPQRVRRHIFTQVPRWSCYARFQLQHHYYFRDQSHIHILVSFK